MDVVKVDLVRANTLMSMFRRGKYELEGEEVLAFAQGVAWLVDLTTKIKVELEKPAPSVALVEPAAQAATMEKGAAEAK